MSFGASVRLGDAAESAYHHPQVALFSYMFCGDRLDIDNDLFTIFMFRYWCRMILYT